MKRRYILLGILICIILFSYSIIDKNYREKYEKKAQYVYECILQEKSWIRQNQDESGAIFLNNTGSAGDVNPYFASLAAQGLLAGIPEQRDLDVVQKYLLWHRQEFLKKQGEVGNYILDNNQLVETQIRDSVDSYVAVYLSLLCQYGMAGGDMNVVDSRQEALQLGMHKLDLLYKDGITKVDLEQEVFYLMDNVEVLSSYQDIIELAKTDEGQKWFGSKKEFFEKKIEKKIDESKTEMVNKLWNQTEERFEVGLSGEQTMHFSGWDKIYPDAIAQVYPMAFDVSLPGVRQSKLYKTLCKNIEWENMQFGTDEFTWSVLSYVAAVSGDFSRAEIYLNHYEKLVGKSREYPFHIADAAWAVKAYAERGGGYTRRAMKGLL